MEFLKGNTLLDRGFQLSITLKGLDGLVEIAGAFLFLSDNPVRVNALVGALTFHLLSHAQNAYISGQLLHASRLVAGQAPHFVFLFLMSHGVAKVTLVTALWFNRLWAYPLMILMLAGFIIYQLYVMIHDPTALLALLTIFDAFVIWLTKVEYLKQREIKSRRAEAARA